MGTLGSLPVSEQSCPGAIVTLAPPLHDEEESTESMLPSLGDDLRAKLAVAEFCVERGKYDAAVDLLHNILKKETVDDGDDNVCDEMEAMTMIVKALRGDGRVRSV
jgi:hypothetical protein